MLTLPRAAGAIPIDVPAMGIDVLCFTGHKSLLGPTGTGGVYLNPAITPEPFMRGGTAAFRILRSTPSLCLTFGKPVPAILWE